MSANDRLAEIKARAAARTDGKHEPIDIHPMRDDGSLDVSTTVRQICTECSDDDVVAAIEFGDTVDLSDGERWPCPAADVDWLVAEVERLRADRDRYRRWLGEAISERNAAQAEMFQIALDTSPAYAQLRNERDSARRERDEAMTKLDELRATPPASRAVLARLDSAVASMQERKTSEPGEFNRGWNAAIAASSVIVRREGGAE